MISLDLFGDPVAKARPKFRRTGKFVQTYDPQEKIKEGIKWQLRSIYKNEPITTPVSIDIIFFMPIPKSCSGIRKRQMANGVIPHMKKPDLDNLNKFYLDCMNKIVLKDDCQVVEMRSKKIYSNKSGILIRVIPLSDEKRELLYENISRDIR